MLRVIRNHRRAAHGETQGYEQLSSRARCRSTPPRCPDQGAGRPRPRARLGRGARRSGERTAIATRRSPSIAPTGTIGLVMDCDTTGIEPDFALVKFKKLAGGGYFKIINRAVPEALRALGYGEARSTRSRPMPSATARSKPGAGHQSRALRAKGFTAEKLGEARRRRWRAPSTSNSSSTNGRSARIFCTGTLKVPAAQTRRSGLRPAALPRLHQGRDRSGQYPCLRRDDARRRAASEARTLRRVRLRQSLRPHRQALSLGRKPYPHDGGVAALHLRRDFQDHQHAE